MCGRGARYMKKISTAPKWVNSGLCVKSLETILASLINKFIIFFQQKTHSLMKIVNIVPTEFRSSIISLYRGGLEKKIHFYLQFNLKYTP